MVVEREVLGEAVRNGGDVPRFVYAEHPGIWPTSGIPDFLNSLVATPQVRVCVDWRAVKWRVVLGRSIGLGSFAYG